MTSSHSLSPPPPTAAAATPPSPRLPPSLPPSPGPPPAAPNTFQYLIDNQIHSISGDVWCKRCEQIYQMEFDLREKFDQVAEYIEKEKHMMYDRAPVCWMNPVLPSCRFCQQENSVKPVMAEKKKNINWLFLFLGQMLGCCTLEQLKYFCKHTRNHRTGAKDRVLYLTSLTLWKQIVSNGPFEYCETFCFMN